MAVALSAMRLRLRSNSSQVIATLVLILEQHVPFGDGAAHTAANASHGCSAPNAKPQSRVRRRHCASRSPRSGVRYQLRDPAARTSEIVVNDLDRRPAEHASAMGEAILAAMARMVVQALINGRLANIDAGRAPKMLAGDLAHCRLDRARAGWKRAQSGGPRSACGGKSVPIATADRAGAIGRGGESTGAM